MGSLPANMQFFFRLPNHLMFVRSMHVSRPAPNDLACFCSLSHFCCLLPVFHYCVGCAVSCDVPRTSYAPRGGSVHPFSFGDRVFRCGLVNCRRLLGTL